jgi:hypothetical protein
MDSRVKLKLEAMVPRKVLEKDFCLINTILII